MISPALPRGILQGLPSEISKLPAYIVWAKDDEVNYFSESQNVINAFPASQMLIFQQIRIDDSIPEWMTHSPELVKIEEFQLGVDSFLKKENIIKS